MGIAGIITGLRDRTLANMKRRITFPFNLVWLTWAFSSIQISVTVLVGKPPPSSAWQAPPAVSAVLHILQSVTALPDSATKQRLGKRASHQEQK